MASGDSGRTWFPELVDELRASWQPDTRGIKRARVRCFHCGHVGPGVPPVISVRAVILALQRFGIEQQDAVHRLDKAWAKHRAQQQLYLRGKEVQTGELPSHAHAGEHA